MVRGVFKFTMYSERSRLALALACRMLSRIQISRKRGLLSAFSLPLASHGQNMGNQPLAPTHEAPPSHASACAQRWHREAASGGIHNGRRPDVPLASHRRSALQAFLEGRGVARTWDHLTTCEWRDSNKDSVHRTGFIFCHRYFTANGPLPVRQCPVGRIPCETRLGNPGKCFWACVMHEAFQMETFFCPFCLPNIFEV